MSNASLDAAHAEAQEIQYIQDTVLSIYAQCWDEFHRWKRRDSALVLASLNGTREPFKASVDEGDTSPQSQSQPSQSSQMEDEDDDDEEESSGTTTVTRVIDVFPLPDNGIPLNREASNVSRPQKTRSHSRPSRLHLESRCTVTQTKWFESLPTYENCTFYDSESAQMDDVDLAYLDFVPFADEPEFDKEEYCSAFDLMWETDTWERDPDSEYILL